MVRTSARLTSAVSFFVLLVQVGLGQDVVINELHYNPAEGGVYEFMEIYNAGLGDVDLTGWTISDGVVFTFPVDTLLAAGAYLVIAEDAALYTGSLQWTDGGLSNGGERVAISDAGDVVIDEVTYGDSGEWPGEPDGSGPSLELVHPDFPNDSPRVWAASLLSGGTPGAENSAFSSAPLVLSEEPARGTLVASLAEISVTFVEPVFGVTGGDLTVNGSAALDVTGSDAGPYVFSGFAVPGAGEIDVVLAAGLIEDGDANAFAGDAWSYVGETTIVVINELHYHPDETFYPLQEVEFLELYNADDHTIDLSDWTVSDGVEFTFPPGTLLDAGAYLVVARDAAALETATGYAGALQWTSGGLSNGGERVAISNAFGLVVDEVTYSDGGQWSAEPDGDGPSLELANPGLPNEFGLAWRASTVVNGTPGAVNSTFEAAPAPIVYNTSHSPALPAGLEAVTITTTVLDDGGGMTDVTLHYREDQDPPVAYSTMMLLDDGAGDDAEAGDSVYTATMAGLPADARYDFYITADDGSSVSTVPPGHTEPDIEGNPSQTFLCGFTDEDAPTDFVVYRLLITQVNQNIQESLPLEERKREFDATFIDGQGNVFYNVTERYRGSSSLNQLPRSYRVSFSADQPLLSEWGFPLTRLQLMSQSPMRTALGYELFHDAGLAAPLMHFARLRVNDVNFDTEHLFESGNGYAGVYAAVERVDEEFLSSHDGAVVPPRGLDPTQNLYRGEKTATLAYLGEDPDAYRTDETGQNGYEKVTNEAEDNWDDLITLVTALNNTTDEEFPDAVAALVDEDEWARWFAIQMLLGNREGGIYRDTGDDYYLYFSSADPAQYNTIFIPWDMDSVLRSDNETIWRTSVPAVVRFLRNNAFAPIFVGNIRALLDNEFSQAAMDARIDALPDAVFATSGGSGGFPLTKQQFKDWVASRHAFVDAEIIAELTLDLGGIPTLPYTDPNPVISISGTLNQAGTHGIVVNGEPADFSVFDGAWSAAHTLSPGENTLVVQALDRVGEEMERIEQYILYDPPPASMRLTAPTRMIDTQTVTLKAELLDVNGAIDWRGCTTEGTVSAVRVSDQTEVPMSIVVFDEHDGTPAPDSILFYSGVGSVSLTLDNGAAEPAGDIEITVTAGALSASKIVTVLDADEPGLFKPLSGALAGSDLTWGPADGVIHLVDDCTVPVGETLTILAGTLIMADAGAPQDGVVVNVAGSVNAVGTATDPIFFFPTEGPDAMHIELAQDSNPDSWRGFTHTGTGISVYQWAIFTGAGNGPGETHPRPAVLGFQPGHDGVMSDCVMVDNPGKGVAVRGAGDYQVRRCLFSRCGHGNEYTSGGYTMLAEDSWYTAIGHAPDPFDGDFMNIRVSNSPSLFVRGCVFADGGDDGIDTFGTGPTIEHCIFYDIRDKAVSMEGGGSPTFYNLLIFDTPIGIRVTSEDITVEHVTMGQGVGSPITNAGSGTITKSIIWPATFDTCGVHPTTYCNVGAGSDISCGAGNIDTNPMFLDPDACSYELHPDSPAMTTGPEGERIGWLGTLGVSGPPTPVLGDVNCDGLVNAFDIDAFVVALTDPAAYAVTYPDCDIDNADVNEDGVVNAFDIDPFVNLLTGG